MISPLKNWIFIEILKPWEVFFETWEWFWAILLIKNHFKCFKWLEMNEKDVWNHKTEIQCSNIWPHVLKMNGETWKRELKWFFSRIHALQHTKKFVRISRMLVVKKKLPEVYSKIHNRRFGVLTFEKMNFYRKFWTGEKCFLKLESDSERFFWWKFILNVSNDWKWVIKKFKVNKRKSSVPTPDLTSSQQVVKPGNGN